MARDQAGITGSERSREAEETHAENTATHPVLARDDALLLHLARPPLRHRLYVLRVLLAQAQLKLVPRLQAGKCAGRMARAHTQTDTQRG